MESLVICNFSTPTSNLIPKSPQRLLLNTLSLPNTAPVRFCLRKTRGSSVVTRAGPGTNTYIFAFVLPLSLLAITVFTSIRIADKLDREFLEEIAVNQAIMEAEEEDGDAGMSFEEKPSLPRTRNRPKREAETSSM
ncbi:V-set and immunoglobulin domain-containing protein [Actinidia chinensis var. chinensis]|uniref:V-set and immunoglobulin domain-containing protein n=1 Tax=Actinidia chinensis var. chinensis TaxID=1590841 RepID=A0A2R6R1N8_ACTCC|nr:V-set and immunoglobulin domain-containing protein [Actinidia chinensis var. chinensis]